MFRRRDRSLNVSYRDNLIRIVFLYIIIVRKKKKERNEIAVAQIDNRTLKLLRRSSSSWIEDAIFPEESISARKIKRTLYACSKVYFLTRAYQEVSAQVSLHRY